MIENLLSLLKYDDLNHAFYNYESLGQDLLQRYEPYNYKFFTVILNQKIIDKEMFIHTPYVFIEPQTFISPIRKEAFQIMDREHGNNYQWVEDIINLHYPKETTDRMVWTKEYDHYLECLLQSYYSQALENLLYEWACFEKFNGDSEDFEEEDYQKIIQENPQEVEQYKKSLFLPVYEKLYKLNYEAILPDPLGKIGHMCLRKQYYFMRENNILHVAKGCGCGSGTRYNHGLYGHFFTLLQDQKIPITSFITEIDENCEFKIIKQADHLILYRHHLIGNYQVDGQTAENVFAGIEMYP